MSTPDPAGTAALVERRAQLLVDRAGPELLGPATDALAAALATATPTVRRVRRDESDLVEHLVEQEPVHPFAGPDDVDDRFDDDRRCFVLEHPLLPGRPLNVVFVALCSSVPTRITDLLEPTAPTDDPAGATTAVFYSIWNVEPGARGLDGGRRLIAGAVELLAAELPGLDTFVTLSPVPGLRRWAEVCWPEELDPDHPDLLRAAATYLTSLEDGRPVDAVAGFHLGNGARLVGLHRHADPSVRGDRRSWGVMANYRYVPKDRPANQALLGRGVVATSAEVAALLTVR
ncbi:MAG: malonyl-CoA decarboxylase domain-containing protein [Actinomycetes bacterium]